MRFLDFLSPDRVALAVEVGAPRSKPEILRALARLLAKGARGLSVDEVERVLHERERLQSTGIGGGVAIPHGVHEGLSTLVGAVLIAPRAVPFDAIDRLPVSLFFSVLGPKSASGEHLKALARISRLLRELRVREGLLQATNGREVYSILAHEELKGGGA
jgi:PTS system nitrogen regulatory IIA component